MNAIDVIGLGALNVDHIYRVKRILVDGESTAQEAASFPGGSAANTIYALARLGISTGFMGAVGDDSEGELLLQSFHEAGVGTGQIKTMPGARSGAALCLSDSLNRRSLYISPGANSLLTMADIDIDYVNHCNFLHITSFVDDKQFQMTLKLLDVLDAGVKVSFSPGNLYAAKGLEALAPVLARTHVLFVNYNELRQLTGKSMAAGVKKFMEKGCRIVAVTMGKGRRLTVGRGKLLKASAYVRNADGEYLIEPAKSDMMPAEGSTGAGDAFAAGFLYGLLKEKPLAECGQLGNLVARFCLTSTGARAGLPRLNELAQRYEQVYGKRL